jgi:hypothetical protein
MTPLPIDADADASAQDMQDISNGLKGVLEKDPGLEHAPCFNLPQPPRPASPLQGGES